MHSVAIQTDRDARKDVDCQQQESLVTMNQQTVIVLHCKWSVRSCYMYYSNFHHLGGSNSKERGRMSQNASERIQRCSVFGGER